MKKIFLFLTVIFLSGCSINNSEIINHSVKDLGLNIMIIDDCEYLYGIVSNVAILTHKGNCKNHKVIGDK